jgi:hypothetical protein
MNNNKNKNNNKNNLLKKISLEDKDYTVITVSLLLFVLFIIFMFYEFYFKNNMNVKSKGNFNDDYEILLDYKNNNNEPYHFKQSFGTDVDYEPQMDLENPNVINLDKKFDFLQEVKCDSMNNQFTLHFNIKFPYVYSNKYWKTSFRKMKPILDINKSPVLKYNPLHNYLELSIKYKTLSDLVKIKYIKIKNILIEKWLDIHIVVDNRKIKIYMNKELIYYELLDSVPIININKNAIIKFGEFNNNFNGLVKKIKFYRKPLTSQEIKNL